MTRQVLDELESIVLRGEVVSGRTNSPFRIRDGFFRNAIAFWTSPSIDAIYFGLECLRALRRIGSVPVPPNIDELCLDQEHLRAFVLAHYDESGGFRHSVHSAEPSLFGMEMALSVLAEARSQYARRGALIQRLSSQELADEIGPARAEAMVRYVLGCELPSGGFRERAALVGGVITTDRGLRILEGLGVPPNHLDAHVEFLRSCWIYPSPGAAVLMNRPTDRQTWISPVRYCLSTMSRHLRGAARQALLQELTSRVDSVVAYIEECRSADGGFAYAPGDDSSIAGTWDVLRLGSNVRELIEKAPTYAGVLSKLSDACWMPSDELLSLLLAHKGAGWTPDSPPNLYTVACALRIMQFVLDDPEAEHDLAFDLVQSLTDLLSKFVVSTDSGMLLQGYAPA